MKAKKPKGRPAIVGDALDPRGFPRLVEDYLASLAVRGFSPHTLATKTLYLALFSRWAEERGLARPGDITKPILERYQRFLFHYRQKNGKPLSSIAQIGRTVALRSFFRWLARQNLILYNPASDLELPKKPHKLPRHVLTAQEAETLLALPDTSEPIGLRDRALLETFYSSGIRRGELIALSVGDVDWDHGTLRIRHGKGSKERVVPIGDRALAWLEKYLADGRPQLATGEDDRTLFLTGLGTAYQPDSMSRLVQRYVREADLGKVGSCHLLRHTCATLMLENGADVRFLQELLGHASLEATQIYTHVSIRKLKEIHTATHPACRDRRTAGEHASPQAAHAASSLEAPTAEMFARLDAEALDEAEPDADPAATGTDSGPS